MNWAVVSLNLFILHQIRAQQFTPTENQGSGLSDFNNFQANQEHLVLESMAKADNILGDDEQEPRGNLDPFSNYDYEEELDTRPKLVVQKVGMNKQTTTYHSFDDGSSTQIPLFTRSIEDLDNDYIIFMNPAFPSGTGHYVVLRKLEAQISPQNAFIDEALSAEIPVTFPSIADYQTTESAHPGFLSEGFVQSGEENYKDINTNDGVEMGNSQETLPQNYIPQQMGSKNPQLSGYQNIRNEFYGNTADPNSMDSEIIYEAFTITFKESIHGYISDAEPLELNFMSNYDEGFYQYDDELGNPQSFGVPGDDDVIPEELVDGVYPKIELPPGGQGQIPGISNANRRFKRSPPWDSDVWPQCLKPMVELKILRSHNIWEKAV